MAVVIIMEKKQYYKRFEFVTFFKVLKRNLISILVFDFVFCLFGFVYLNFFTPTIYQTSSQLDNKRTITPALLNVISASLKSDDVLDEVILKLQSQDIYQGSYYTITKNEIKDNLILPQSTNSAYLVISYRGKHKEFLKDTLFTILDIGINYIQAQTNQTELNELKIFDEPTEPVDISNNKQKLIIFGLTGLVLSYGVSFIVDYKYDLVYDIGDIKDLDTNVLELNYTERKKEKHE